MPEAGVESGTTRVNGAGFGTRLAAAFATTGHLCVGIDPHASLLDDWGLPQSAAGVREFALRTIEAAAGRATAVKPQVAFFERFGSAGFAVLEEVLATAREAGLLVVADAKRGDIGSSIEGYGSAWLESGSPLRADALTVYAYQGLAEDEPLIRRAVEHGSGLFVVTATSNPGALATQSAVRASGSLAGRTVAGALAAEIGRRNLEILETTPGAGLGPVGIVIGGTLELEALGLDRGELAPTPILAPGFGFQGATYADLARVYGAALPNTLVSASRSILSAGPDGLVAAVTRDAEELAREYAA